MLVQDVMQREVITITPETALPEALEVSRGAACAIYPC